MPIIFRFVGLWDVPFYFGSHECCPPCDARFHFIATYLCGICLLSICWNTIVTARLVLWTTGWGCIICKKISSGAVSSGLCFGVCGLVLRGGGFCRHKDRFVFCCLALSSRLLFSGGGGGGGPIMFDRRLFPRINNRYGVGFLRNAVPYGWLLICDEKTTRTDSFLRFKFCQNVDVSSVIFGDILVRIN